MQQFGEGFETVLSAAQANAPWALQRLYDALAPVVHGYLRGQGAHDAEDLTSEVFLGVFRRLETFSGDEAAFRSWVFTIAHRRLVDERRRLTRRPAPQRLGAAGEGIPGGDVEVEALAHLEEERVRKLLSGLSADQRDVLLLRVIADLTVEQVAVSMGKTPGAVKALQRRGLAALRKEIERQGVPL